MKKYISILSVFVLLILSACNIATPVAEQTSPVAQATSVPTEAPKATEAPAATEASNANEQAEAKIEVKFAKGFTYEQKEGYRLLTVLDPQGKAQAQYALVPQEGEVKVAEADALVIKTPVEKIVSMSSTYLPFLDELGQLDKLVAVDSATYIYNENVRKAIDEKKIAVVGGGADMDNANIELITSLQPDFVMLSSMNTGQVDTAKLTEAGIPSVMNGDFLENNPLGRAEWGKFIAAFFNQEGKESELFDKVVADYNAVKETAAKAEKAPTVVLNNAYQGSWYMPGAESYVALFMKDANADYLFADDVPGTSSTALTFEKVYEKGINAEYWLNVGLAADLKSLLAEDERYGEFAAFKDGNVFNYNARMNANGGTDYFESGVAHPEVVLKDLVKIFHPELLPEYELFYYMQLK